MADEPIPESPINFILSVSGTICLVRCTQKELYEKLRVYQFHNERAEIHIHLISGNPLDGFPGAVVLKRIDILRCTNPVHSLVYKLSAEKWVGSSEAEISRDIDQVILLMRDRRRQLTEGRRLRPPDYDSGSQDLGSTKSE